MPPAACRRLRFSAPAPAPPSPAMACARRAPPGGAARAARGAERALVAREHPRLSSIPPPPPAPFASLQPPLTPTNPGAPAPPGGGCRPATRAHPRNPHSTLTLRNAPPRIAHSNRSRAEGSAFRRGPTGRLDGRGGIGRGVRECARPAGRARGRARLSPAGGGRGAFERRRRSERRRIGAIEGGPRGRERPRGGARARERGPGGREGAAPRRASPRAVCRGRAALARGTWY